jgi:hypothetical protein
MARKLKAAKITVLEEIKIWVADSGARCGRWECLIAGEKGTQSVICFSSTLKGVESLLEPGEVFHADLVETDGDSDWKLTRLQLQAQSKSLRAVLDESYGGAAARRESARRYEERMRGKGWVRDWIQPIQGNIWAYVWKRANT